MVHCYCFLILGICIGTVCPPVGITKGELFMQWALTILPSFCSQSEGHLWTIHPRCDPIET